MIPLDTEKTESGCLECKKQDNKKANDKAGGDRTTVKGDERAADWCYNQLRKPYNFNYQNIYRRDAFYCSQLIHAAFWDLYRIDLNTSLFGQAVHPLELMNNGQVSLVYQLKD